MKQLVMRLSLLALGCGILLSTTHALSKQQIEANRINFKTRQLVSILGDTNAEIIRLAEDLYRIEDDHKLLGFLFSRTTDQGYNGEIKMILAVAVSGQVLGARVIEHRETPGLGDPLDLAVSDWILSFDGHSLASANWLVKKDGGDFDQFTGATITPRAVVGALKQGLQYYDTEKENWMTLER